MPAALAVTALVALALVFFWSREHSSGVLENWLAQQGFEPQRPPGADLQPGTVLFVSGASDYVALSAAEFAGDQIKFIQGSTPREITLEVSGASTVTAQTKTAGASNQMVAGTTATGSGRATVLLQHVRTLTLPLNHIADLTRNSERLTQALRRSPDALFIVTDAIVADAAELKFDDRVSSDSDLQSRIAAARQKLGIALSSNESGRILATGPLVLGVRLASCRA